MIWSLKLVRPVTLSLVLGCISFGQDLQPRPKIVNPTLGQIPDRLRPAAEQIATANPEVIPQLVNDATVIAEARAAAEEERQRELEFEKQKANSGKPAKTRRVVVKDGGFYKFSVPTNDAETYIWKEL